MSGSTDQNLGLGSAAVNILQRGVELDKCHRYTESLICYQEGLQLLLDMLQGTQDKTKKEYLRKRVEEYMGRAEFIKKHVKEQKDLGKYHEQIVIQADSKGHDYAKVFGRFLDSDVQSIKVEDPYIRSFHQCQNFLRFCELAVRNCPNLKSISLTTTLENSQQASNEQLQRFEMIKKSLRGYNVSLSIETSDTLHDRTIRLSTGWIIKIGRGLDYFKPPESKFSLGLFDMNFRHCHETVVDIFHSKDVRLKN